MNTETNDQHHRELGHLGSAFKASTTTSCASDLDLDPAQSFWSAAANTDVTTSTSDPASSAPRRRSTTADILAHMLGSATDTSAPSASDFLANHHHTASSSSLGLASPAQLALSVEDGTNSGHCHYHYKRFRPNSFPGTVRHPLFLLSCCCVRSFFPLSPLTEVQHLFSARSRASIPFCPLW